MSRGFRINVLGNVNGWTCDGKRNGIIDAFGVAGKNKNGRKGNDFLRNIKVYESR